MLNRECFGAMLNNEGLEAGELQKIEGLINQDIYVEAVETEVAEVEAFIDGETDRRQAITKAI